jgi:Flp pilus assembly protein TadD
VLAVTPALGAVSQSDLNKSVSAWRRGDCNTAIDKALSSSSALSVRPEPYEILSFCDVRAGQYKLAIDSMAKAISRDPDNWEFRYGLAIVRGAAGEDARGDAALAHKMNPRNPLARNLSRAYAAAKGPREWRRRALEARLPIN